VNVEQQLVIELNRRAHLLQEELDLWEQLANSPESGMGIHRSQLEAIEILYRGFQRKLEQRLQATVDVQGHGEEFSVAVVALEQQLMAAHGVMAVFRMILGQRSDNRFFRQALDAADLVAADCYKLCVDHALAWKATSKEEVRVPPLTYLNTMYSPAAITRTGRFGAFKMPMDGNLNLRLPIGVVSLPFHHTEAIWTFASLYHEVGHQLDTDFGLRSGLREQLDKRLAGSPRKPYWSRRLLELVADAFGVLLGGEGYARLLVKLLYLPQGVVRTLDDSDLHPNHYVRVFLIGALLRGSRNDPPGAAAASFEEAWRTRYGEPGDLQPYIDDCDLVAEVLLDQPLACLNNHPIRDFVPAATLASDQEQVQELSSYLRRGIVPPKLEVDGVPFPVRLVPAAAQLAMEDVKENHAALYKQIHELALDFVRQLRGKLPKFLGPADLTELSEPRRQHFEALVEEVDLDALEDETA
jgi:hypothetical protein